ncbi:EAL domain-containing response regulator [Sphingomonas sp.]|jgi:diguanylate cyclase (GGDEF)-like protein|uniref:EAL domain-containing response regulator n=1 Tax=Sphingomonas sp. TaxID=28214 RepID=UPI002ED7BCF0
MRILVVDDDEATRFRYAASLASDAEPEPVFHVVYCGDGRTAIDALVGALADDVPFAAVFIDIATPQGRETAARIRETDPDVHIVIVTAQPLSPFQICALAGPADKVFYIAKPFEPGEIVQTATALCKRWTIDRERVTARANLRTRVLLLEEQKLELAANESRAIHIATHDPLTEAPNRLAFLRALGDRVRRPGTFATAMLDLDRFKLVNDTLGHLAGDALIREMCAILQASAPEGSLVARLGGDEFGILFDTIDQITAVAACERVVAACAVSIMVFGNSVQAGASAGIVATQGGSGEANDVMRRADLALNEAKRHRRGGVRLFDESMDEGIRFRRRIENGLTQAIANGELSLVFQPIVERDGLAIDGFEALLRWESPEYGAMSPAVFIPIAEESNLIHEIGDWVLDRALAALQDWPKQYVSVNFSPRQFRRHDFVHHVIAALQRTGTAPARLQVEITETAIFDDATRAAETLEALRHAGCRVALDDFGTGYSSLYNIRKFALDSLKIDRSFIDGIGRERESAAIVYSIIHLGRALGLGVIAEGVETAAQVQALRIAGASHLQGYFLSRPVDAGAARGMARAGVLPQVNVDPAIDAALANGGAG